MTTHWTSTASCSPSWTETPAAARPSPLRQSPASPSSSWVWEKLDQIEVFHPDRMASRILGMGDEVFLIEKAQATIDEEKAKELEQKIRKNRFTLQDFLTIILRPLRRWGRGATFWQLPGLSGKLDESQLDDNMFAKTEAIILSMTKKEREDASLINASRRRRIAMGSGTTVADVNALLKQFGMMQHSPSRCLGARCPVA